MQFSPTSYLIPSSQTSKLLRVLVVGPELLANALYALLTKFDDLHLLAPICEPEQVMPFIQRLGSTQHPVDVVVLHWSGDLERDHMLLAALSAAGQRSLIVTSLYCPDEIAFIKQSGAWGLFFTSSSVHHLATALRSIAHGQKYFPQITSSTPNLTYLTRQRQMTFHEERLRALARSIMWDLKETEIKILRHLTNSRVEDIAEKTHLKPTTVRRVLSMHVYEFLELVAGRSISNHLAALQVLYEFGVIEYILPPPASSPQTNQRNQSPRKR